MNFLFQGLSTTMNCEVCKEHSSKYKCPQCKAKTCSMECSSKHRDICEGSKEITTFTIESEIPSEDDDYIPLPKERLHSIYLKAIQTTAYNEQKETLQKILHSNEPLQTIKYLLENDSNFREFCEFLLNDI